MNNEQMLLAAIHKAEGNGWNPYLIFRHAPKSYELGGNRLFYFADEDHFATCNECEHNFSHEEDDEVDISEILFDKEFWKALVGDKYMVSATSEVEEDGYNMKPFITNFKGEEWQYHGQQIFLEDDRIAYLKMFI